MFSVVFEVYPKREAFDRYLDLAKELRPILERIDGFIDNERFQSSRRPGWILSHSTWRDEKSVVRWRTTAKHHETQQRGRDDVFADYHLRVGEIVADTAPPAGLSVVEQRLDETEIGAAKFVTLNGDRFLAAVAAQPNESAEDAIAAYRLAFREALDRDGRMCLCGVWGPKRVCCRPMLRGKFFPFSAAALTTSRARLAVSTPKRGRSTSWRRSKAVQCSPVSMGT